MAMLTRCVACSTTFRITTEQLISRQGKVRCGACGEVFSALQNLVHSRDENTSAPPVEKADLTPADLASSALTVPSLTTASVVLNVPAPPVAELPPDSENPLPDPLSDELTDSTAEQVQETQIDLPRAKKTAWWALAGIVLATITLTAQAAYFYRNEVAVRVPETKPWLEQVCLQAGCKLEVPRDAQAISIESSDLQADPANRNLLTLVALLRNRASFGQEVPHLELALTDAQDALVARRVLLPRDYAGTALFAAGAEIQMRVVIDAGLLKASGYRLYAFYP